MFFSPFTCACVILRNQSLFWQTAFTRRLSAESMCEVLPRIVRISRCQRGPDVLLNGRDWNATSRSGVCACECVGGGIEARSMSARNILIAIVWNVCECESNEQQSCRVIIIRRTEPQKPYMSNPWYQLPSSASLALIPIVAAQPIELVSCAPNEPSGRGIRESYTPSRPQQYTRLSQ